MRGGAIEDAPFTAAIPHSTQVFAGLEPPRRQPVHGAIELLAALSWPGMQEHHRREGHQGVYLLPLVVVLLNSVRSTEFSMLRLPVIWRCGAAAFWSV